MVSEFTNIYSAKMYRVTLSPNRLCALMNQRQSRSYFAISSLVIAL